MQHLPVLHLATPSAVLSTSWQTEPRLMSLPLVSELVSELGHLWWQGRRNRLLSQKLTADISVLIASRILWQMSGSPRFWINKALCQPGYKMVLLSLLQPGRP